MIRRCKKKISPEREKITFERNKEEGTKLASQSVPHITTAPSSDTQAVHATTVLSDYKETL